VLLFLSLSSPSRTHKLTLHLHMHQVQRQISWEAGADHNYIVRTVSRLDAPTSGCMVRERQHLASLITDESTSPSIKSSSMTCHPQVLPLCSVAEAALTSEFKNHRMMKTYVALCHGVTPTNGRIAVRLKTISTVTRHFAVPHPRGKQAVTEYTRVAVLHAQSSLKGVSLGQSAVDESNSCSSYSLLLVTPVTGRMHQIRAHFNHIGHPLDGDGRCARLLMFPHVDAL
jgi:23S rRNA-/tRNA-specific pseudouridylate synthase